MVQKSRRARPFMKKKNLLKVLQFQKVFISTLKIELKNVLTNLALQSFELTKITNEATFLCAVASAVSIRKELKTLQLPPCFRK